MVLPYNIMMSQCYHCYKICQYFVDLQPLLDPNALSVTLNTGQKYPTSQNLYKQLIGYRYILHLLVIYTCKQVGTSSKCLSVTGCWVNHTVYSNHISPGALVIDYMQNGLILSPLYYFYCIICTQAKLFQSVYECVRFVARAWPIMLKIFLLCF